MGVVTTADRMIEEAKEHLEKAIYYLKIAYNRDDQMTDGYSDSFYERLEDAEYILKKVKREL
tara:strand:+ start:994 stop:1179 length:186 start_codon:yes stop_codon:yes gene_type:complete